MAKPQYFNDAPIQKPEDDHFGIDNFAQMIARSLKTIKSPVGVTIAINGRWGSGKTCAANLVRYHLNDEIQANKIGIIDFDRFLNQ